MVRRILPVTLLLVAAAAGLTLFAVIRLASERNQAILVECRDQNRRHDATVATLHANTQHALTPVALANLRRELAALGIHASLPAVRQFETLATSQNSQTIALINALAPHRDCASVVNRLSRP